MMKATFGGAGITFFLTSGGRDGAGRAGGLIRFVFDSFTRAIDPGLYTACIRDATAIFCSAFSRSR